MDQKNSNTEQGKKKRAENWSAEEKDILRQLIAEAAHVLENKSNKTNINILKAREWKNVTIKLNELTARRRSEAEIKLAWKRMKMAAKANLSSHRQEQMRTGGGEKPPSPSPEDLAVVAIAPHDFEISFNEYDSDAALVHNTTKKIEKPDLQIAGPSHREDLPNTYEDEYILGDIASKNSVEQDLAETRAANKTKKTIRYGKKDLIINSNINFKKRHLEMLESEHNNNIEIAKLKIRKLSLEIELLEFQKRKLM